MRSSDKDEFTERLRRDALTRWKWKNPFLAGALGLVLGPVGFFYFSWQKALIGMIIVFAGAEILRYNGWWPAPIWLRVVAILACATYAYVDTRWRNAAIEYYKYGLRGTGTERPQKRLKPASGWGRLPKESLATLQQQLGPNFDRLDRLARKYGIFDQPFFGSSIQEVPSFLPQAFAFFLASMGNRLAAGQHLDDAEEAFRLSLQLRPEQNPASMGLASLLALTGRNQEAAYQARLALATIDELEGAKGTPIRAEFEHELGWDEEGAEEVKSTLHAIIKAVQRTHEEESG